jgi:oxygen-independent coproporphyrinogen-3 oxidase
MARVEDYVRALINEIELRAHSEVWASQKFETIYFGGGTPSVLSPDQTSRITSALHASFNLLDTLMESTIEVNPEDVTPESLDAWLRCGFDRISIGIQSFQDSQLSWMNRKHTSGEAIKAVELAHSAGFSKISVDLIYGLPHRERGSWEDTIIKALSLPIDHISCYALTVEPRTVLGSRVAKGIEIEAPDTLVESDYREICAATSSRGFDHYEVSNWALSPSTRAVHNSAYWSGSPYLGLGPGAHGFDGESRYSVISNNPQYIAQIDDGTLPDSIEKLSTEDRRNEMIMTGLRTAEGVSEVLLKENPLAFEKWTASGDLVKAGGGSENYRVSEKSWLIGDGISSDFFEV